MINGVRSGRNGQITVFGKYGDYLNDECYYLGSYGFKNDKKQLLGSNIYTYESNKEVKHAVTKILKQYQFKICGSVSDYATLKWWRDFKLPPNQYTTNLLSKNILIYI